MRARTVLITGCSTGIGRALAQEFQQRGHRVYATARNLESLTELRAQGMEIAQLDVTDPASMQRLTRRLEAENVVVDVLINNAGYGLMGPLLDVRLDEVRQQFETNVVALLGVVQQIFPRLAQPGARIVNLGSVSGILTTPFSGAYCATKAAVHALSDAMRMELKPFGIDVITVMPGAIRSSFGNTASRSAAVEQAQHSRYARIADAIRARAGASQNDATATDVFARAMADAVLASRPRAYVALGAGSTALSLLARWLPVRLRDRILSRRFKLDRMN